MDTSFSRSNAVWLNSVLGAVVEYVLAHAAELGALPLEQRVQRVRDQVGVPATQQPTGPMMGPIPPVLTGPAIPGLTSFPVGAVAVQKKKSGGSRAALDQQRWIDLEAYKAELKERRPVCAYLPNRGENKGRVCGGPAANCATEQNPLKWRCSVDLNAKTGVIKVGDIEKKIVGGTSGINPNRVVSNYSTPGGMPTQVPGMPQLMGGIPALPTGMGGVPPLPSGMGGIPPLPSGMGFVPALPGMSPPAPTQSLIPGMPIAPAVVPQIQVAPAPADRGQIPDLITNPKLPKVFFPLEESRRSLAIMLIDGRMTCIGKIENFAPTPDGPMPPEWGQMLIRLEADDQSYCSSNGLAYDYKGSR